MIKYTSSSIQIVKKSDCGISVLYTLLYTYKVIYIVFSEKLAERRLVVAEQPRGPQHRVVVGCGASILMIHPELKCEL